MHSDEVKIWGSALLLTSFVFSLLFFHWNTRWNATYPEFDSFTKTDQISFTFSSAAAPMSEPEKPRPEVVKNTADIEPPPIRKKIEPIKKTLRQPVIEKPRPPEITKVEKSSRAEDRPEKDRQEKDISQTSVDEFRPQSVAQVISAKQGEKYFQQLLKHIEKHKSYPLAARRRGIQGDVLVSFMLHRDGKITQLSLVAQHSVLKRLSAQAVNSSLPLPLPPADLPLPRQITFNLRYVIR